MSEPLDPAAIASEFDILSRNYLAAFPNAAVQIDLGNRLAMMAPQVNRLAAALADRDARVAAVRGFAEIGATTAHALGQFEFERRWLDLLHLLDRS